LKGQRETSKGNVAYDAIMAKHWEDFLDLSTGELRFYLQQRALTCHGNHADLAARALVAFEQNPPIRETAETVLCVLQLKTIKAWLFPYFTQKLGGWSIP